MHSADLADAETALGLPPGTLTPLLDAVRYAAAEAAAEALAEALGNDATVAVRAALGSNTLLPYTAWLRANGISHERGMKLRRAGELKVLDVGGVLMIRRGEAERFVRALPIADPGWGRRGRASRRQRGKP